MSDNERWGVMDSNGIEHLFKTKKEADNFIKNNDVMKFTSEGIKVRKRKGVLKDA